MIGYRENNSIILSQQVKSVSQKPQTAKNSTRGRNYNREGIQFFGTSSNNLKEGKTNKGANRLYLSKRSSKVNFKSLAL